MNRYGIIAFSFSASFIWVLYTLALAAVEPWLGPRAQRMRPEASAFLN